MIITCRLMNKHIFASIFVKIHNFPIYKRWKKLLTMKCQKGYHNGVRIVTNTIRQDLKGKHDQVQTFEVFFCLKQQSYELKGRKKMGQFKKKVFAVIASMAMVIGLFSHVGSVYAAMPEYEIYPTPHTITYQNRDRKSTRLNSSH